VNTHFLDKESTKCYEILDIFVTLNAMIFYCRVRGTPGLNCPVSAINNSKVLLIRRIKRSPTLQDFTDPSQFEELLYEKQLVLKSCFNGSVTVPIYRNCEGQIDEDYVFNMLGFQRLINRPQMFDKKDLMKLNVISFDIVNT